MIASTDAEQLRALYRNASRHSQYQIMPDFLAAVVDPDALDKKWNRYEKERMDYIAKKIDLRGTKVLDVGGNTGYFSFEALTHGAREAVCYEGNPEHCEFMRVAARAFNKRLSVKNAYMTFDAQLEEGRFDVSIVLNVLHHVGFDFGDKGIDIEEAKRYIIKNLNWFADKTTYMVFQIGFSWMTNYDHPLFPNGTKGEMIDMVRAGITDVWDEVAIGIARERGGATVYEDLSPANIGREDSLGEFRNRPLFILRSRKH